MNEDIFTNQAESGITKCNARKRRSVYLSIALVLTLITSALGIAVTLLQFDSQTRYFTSSALTTALSISIAASLVYAICAPFIFKGILSFDSKNGLTAKYKSLYTLPAIALSACFCCTVLKTDFAKLASDRTALAIWIALVAVFLLSITYNILRTLTRSSATLMLVSGMAQIVLCLYIMVSLYFDLSVELNSPFKLLIQFAAAALLVDTCMELRHITSGVSERAYIAAKTFSAMVGTLSFAVTVCAVARGAKIDSVSYICYSIFFISWALCSAFALINIKTSPDEAPGEITEDLQPEIDGQLSDTDPDNTDSDSIESDNTESDDAKSNNTEQNNIESDESDTVFEESDRPDDADHSRSDDPTEAPTDTDIQDQ